MNWRRQWAPVVASGLVALAIAGMLDDFTGAHTADIMLNMGLLTAATLLFLFATAGWRGDG